MSKIQNDKYYTPPDLAKYCVEKTKEIIGADNKPKKTKYQSDNPLDLERYVKLNNKQ